jgi:hypothetical protein
MEALRPGLVSAPHRVSVIRALAGDCIAGTDG